MVALALALTFSLSGVNAQKGTAEFDVQHYKIDAELIPAEQLLKARAEVRFVPQTDTRSVVFEMNGSLAIKSIRRADAPPAATTAAAAAPQASTPVRTPVTDAKTKAVKEVVKPAAAKTAPAKSGQPAKAGLKEEAVKEVPSDPNELQFIQDARENMNVRVDLGTVAPARQPLTLVFEYQGALESAQGGPINNARLAFVGDSGSYLFYAARWFPFHEYAADRSTYEISLKVPKEVLVAGYSEQPVVPVPSVDPTSKAEFSTYSFVSTKPLLPGNFAAGKYIIRSAKFGGLAVDFYVKAGDEKWADHAVDVVGKHLEFYSTKFGPYAFGNKLVVAETDEETLETYTGAGIMFVSPRALSSGIDEKLAREVAYQWWGQAVGLRSFDDTWLSQGLAEFSTLLYQKDELNEAQYQQTVQAELEKALAFEQSSSIRNAPKQLDDQTPAYRSVVFHKGALVFNMLRQLLGEKEFDKLLQDYYQKYSGKNLTIDEFETFASKAAGRDLRFFFGQWVDSTGVPEFRAEYRMLRLKEGFRVPGTVKQDLDTFEMPVDIILKTEAGNERQTLLLKGTSADFDITTKSNPVEVIVDPDTKLLRSSETLREGVIVRRGIEHFREQEFTEAEQQFQAAIKLNRGNSWAWYNLGLLYMAQRNWKKALDAFEQTMNGNLRPDWIEVWSYIYAGNSWDMVGQRERAIAEYNKAISNGNNYDNAQEAAKGFLAEPFGKKKPVAQNTDN
ncbi:MAG TPA: M1 family aminopeptidase [Blastocatellia bacterium]|nr:M1 family aminopeptidase [Blastocatellia bacterium]HMV82273.1 M1 family aminopeptidase [Blastocatellia bacterium]HMZ19695.1 M1 family aminopeptidase [Blastocatellia bacterium]HNG29527.1 M1 family aminopeptidase [Blastocatellia bacterium]